MMTQGEALSTVQEHIELWDKRFPYEIKLILLRFHRPDKRFYRLEFEKSTFFTVADECVLMDMEGFITLLPGIPGENKVVRFEFEFGEK